MKKCFILKFERRNNNYMKIEVPVKTNMIMSCFECPYVTVRRIGDLHKVFCNNTYEETEVEKKDILTFSMLPNCPYIKEERDGDKIPKLSFYMPTNRLILAQNEHVTDRLNEIIDRVNELSEIVLKKKK